MTGTWLNVIGIVAGGIFGLVRKEPLSQANQVFFKLVLGAVTAFAGLRLVWASVGDSALQLLKQIAIVLVAMTVGKLTGRLLRLQKSSNRIGEFARTRMAAAKPDNRNRFSDGFAVCALLFCAAPLGMLGAVQDGLSSYYLPLLVKAAMDGLAVMGFVSLFGSGVILSAVPVLVFQGTLTVVTARVLRPFLETHELLDSVNATGGLLVFCVALVIFEIKKIEITDYLPSLLWAPVLTWVLR